MPPVPGPAELAFLHVCAITLLEDQGSPTSPLLPLARLVGMIGPYSTRASRQNVVSTIQLTGALIRQELRNRFGCQADGAMAVNLKDFVLDTYLPSVFCTTVASEEELRREARDACSYRRSVQGRVDVEISRIPYLRTRCNPPPMPTIPTAHLDPQWSKKLQGLGERGHTSATSPYLTPSSSAIRRPPPKSRDVYLKDDIPIRLIRILTREMRTPGWHPSGWGLTFANWQ